MMELLFCVGVKELSSFSYGLRPDRYLLCSGVYGGDGACPRREGGR